MSDVMVDLETLSLESNAAILSIGACTITDGQQHKFYSVIDLNEYEKTSNFHVSPSTAMWWGQQSAKAKDALEVDFKESLPDSLYRFKVWLKEIESLTGEPVSIWGNGAAFDNVVLANAYKALDWPVPWSYKGNMCFRTIRRLYPSLAPEFEGVEHNALDDAIYQAKWLEATGVLDG